MLLQMERKSFRMEKKNYLFTFHMLGMHLMHMLLGSIPLNVLLSFLQFGTFSMK